MSNLTITIRFVCLAAICVSSCNPKATTETTQAVPETLTDTLTEQSKLNKLDTIPDEYLFNELEPIRKNRNQIAAIQSWSSIKKKELPGSTEGGEAYFYFKKNELQKIKSVYFGEMGQHQAVYFLKNNQLSFVVEKQIAYNRPIYYDSVSMLENNDTTTFDFNKSSLLVDSSYFKNGILIHQISNQDCGAPFSKEYLFNEQKRLQAEFDKLKSILSAQ